jgi:hypothetical protein
MAIEELMAVVTPPSAPIEAGPMERRNEVEKALGIVLPDDLYEIAMRYGSGRFAGGIEVFNPFSKKYLEYVNMVTGCYRELKQAEGDDFIPYDIFPKSPGFFPWGGSWDGFVMFWHTEGKPNEWPTVLVVGRQADVYEKLQMQMTTLLAKIFKEPMPCVLWDVKWQMENLVGKPFQPLQPYEL